MAQSKSTQESSSIQLFGLPYCVTSQRTTPIQQKTRAVLWAVVTAQGIPALCSYTLPHFPQENSQCRLYQESHPSYQKNCFKLLCFISYSLHLICFSNLTQVTAQGSWWGTPTPQVLCALLSTTVQKGNKATQELKAELGRWGRVWGARSVRSSWVLLRSPGLLSPEDAEGRPGGGPQPTHGGLQWRQP